MADRGQGQCRSVERSDTDGARRHDHRRFRSRRGGGARPKQNPWQEARGPPTNRHGQTLRSDRWYIPLTPREQVAGEGPLSIYPPNSCVVTGAPRRFARRRSPRARTFLYGAAKSLSAPDINAPPPHSRPGEVTLSSPLVPPAHVPAVTLSDRPRGLGGMPPPPATPVHGTPSRLDETRRSGKRSHRAGSFDPTTRPSAHGDPVRPSREVKTQARRPWSHTTNPFNGTPFSSEPINGGGIFQQI